MTYSASIEWLGRYREAGILRLHEGPAGRLGDPYAWCVTLAPGPCAGVWFKGAVGAPPMGSRAAINAALHDEGFRWYRHERHPGTDRYRPVFRPIFPPRRSPKPTPATSSPCPS